MPGTCGGKQLMVARGVSPRGDRTVLLDLAWYREEEHIHCHNHSLVGKKKEEEIPKLLSSYALPSWFFPLAKCSKYQRARKPER